MCTCCLTTFTMYDSLGKETPEYMYIENCYMTQKIPANKAIYC